MHKFLIGLVLMALSGGALAVDVVTPGGTISVSLPADFTALNKKEIQVKFARNGQLPVAAFGNSGRSSTVAVSWGQLGDSALSSDQLPQLSKQLHESFDQQLPGIRWINSEVRQIGGKSWILLENTTPSRDGRVHNQIYCTDLKGNLLMLNLNTTEAEHPAYAKAFKAAAESLKVK